jgi:hypothetical protein
MRVVYACDVGSTKVNEKTNENRFGWARLPEDQDQPQGGKAIDKCLESLAADVKSGHHLALGMECPLFLPMPESSEDLSSGRQGEEDRSCFAPPGGYVATLGLHQLAWLLKKIKTVQPDVGHHFTCDLADWMPVNPQGKRILLWEAFVSKQAHSEEHERDAATAVTEFQRRFMGNPKFASDIEEEGAVLSLAGVALLWAEWSVDLGLLSARPHVIKVVDPKRRYTGSIIKAV